MYAPRAEVCVPPRLCTRPNHYTGPHSYAFGDAPANLYVRPQMCTRLEDVWGGEYASEGAGARAFT